MFDMIWEALGMAQLLENKEVYNNETTKKPVLNTSAQKYSYRPKTLDEYIGQTQAKELVKLTLRKIIEIKPCHIIISGHAGTGKTTLANVIANNLSFSMKYYIAGTFTLDHLHQFIVENENSILPMILFLDEIHNLDKFIAEYMYPLAEDFKLNNHDIRPFILIGATTEKFSLIKKFKPLVDRCGCQITLSDYTAEDMNKIISQYNNQIYKETLSDEILNLLARNCRFTPRIAISLVDDYIVCKNIKQVLSSRRILDYSITEIDKIILEHLLEMQSPIGEETLAIIGGVEKSDYKTLIEPFLLQQGYISRKSRGRVITEKGKQLLQILNKEVLDVRRRYE